MSDAKDISDAAQAITKEVVSQLRDAASTADAATPRLFFPHGIELIDVVVKVGPADVEIRIAGEKGIKLSAAQLRELEEEEEDENMQFVVRTVDATDTALSSTVQAGDEIDWFNMHPSTDVTIAFTRGSPLTGCTSHFVVAHNTSATNPGAKTTIKSGLCTGTEFPYTVNGVSIPGGMPKIIIQ